MKHKGYEATVEYSDEDECFVGRVINTRDMIVFEGRSVAELKKAFRAMIDGYLKDCEKRGKKPDKPFSGRFVLRLAPEDHQRASIAATKARKSLNAWAVEAIRKAM